MFNFLLQREREEARMGVLMMKGTRAKIWGCFVFALPCVIGLGLGVKRLMLQNFTDGAFYLGYAMHYELNLEQGGFWYYSVRWPAILWDALWIGTFGEWGFVMGRYFL
ncbi:MAG: hypothetical protein N2035_08740, partial [Chthoniobacterales bacterium]|nr:hypothetical protein [Chthoniobacterales bacterium]